MKKGIVKFFNESKGFGFISTKESSIDIFVYSTGLIDNITQGDKVQFNTQEGLVGLCAIDVTKVI